MMTPDRFSKAEEPPMTEKDCHALPQWVRVSLRPPDDEEPFHKLFALDLWVHREWFCRDELFPDEKQPKVGNPPICSRIYFNQSDLRFRELPCRLSRFTAFGESLEIDHFSPMLDVTVNCNIHVEYNDRSHVRGRLLSGSIRINDVFGAAVTNAAYEALSEFLWPQDPKLTLEQREMVRAIFLGRSKLHMEIGPHPEAPEAPEGERKHRRLEFVRLSPGEGGVGALWKLVSLPERPDLEDPRTRLDFLQGEIVEIAKKVAARKVADPSPFEIETGAAEGGIFSYVFYEHAANGRIKPRHVNGAPKVREFLRPGLTVTYTHLDGSKTRWTPSSLIPHPDGTYELVNFDEIALLLDQGKTVHEEVKADETITIVWSAKEPSPVLAGEAATDDPDAADPKFENVPALYLAGTDLPVGTAEDYFWQIATVSPKSDGEGLREHDERYTGLPPVWIRHRLGAPAGPSASIGPGELERLHGLSGSPFVVDYSIKRADGDDEKWTLSIDVPHKARSTASTSPLTRMRMTFSNESNKCVTLDIVSPIIAATAPKEGIRLYRQRPVSPEAVPFDKKVEDGLKFTALTFRYDGLEPRAWAPESSATSPVLTATLRHTGVQYKCPETVVLGFLPAEKALVDPVSATGNNLQGALETFLTVWDGTVVKADNTPEPSIIVDATDLDERCKGLAVQLFSFRKSDGNGPDGTISQTRRIGSWSLDGGRSKLDVESAWEVESSGFQDALSQVTFELDQSNPTKVTLIPGGGPTEIPSSDPDAYTGLALVIQFAPPGADTHRQQRRIIRYEVIESAAPGGASKQFIATVDRSFDLSPGQASGWTATVPGGWFVVGPARFAFPRDPNHGLVPVHFREFELRFAASNRRFAELKFHPRDISATEVESVTALLPHAEWGPRVGDWLKTGRVRLHHRNLILEHAEFESSFEDRFPAPEQPDAATGAPAEQPGSDAAGGALQVPGVVPTIEDFINAVRDRYTKASGNLLFPYPWKEWKKSDQDDDFNDTESESKKVHNWLPNASFVDSYIGGDTVAVRSLLGYTVDQTGFGELSKLADGRVAITKTEHGLSSGNRVVIQGVSNPDLAKVLTSNERPDWEVETIELDPNTVDPTRFILKQSEAIAITPPVTCFWQSFPAVNITWQRPPNGSSLVQPQTLSISKKDAKWLEYDVEPLSIGEKAPTEDVKLLLKDASDLPTETSYRVTNSSAPLIFEPHGVTSAVCVGSDAVFFGVEAGHVVLWKPGTVPVNSRSTSERYHAPVTAVDVWPVPEGDRYVGLSAGKDGEVRFWWLSVTDARVEISPLVKPMSRTWLEITRSSEILSSVFKSFANSEEFQVLFGCANGKAYLWKLENDGTSTTVEFAKSNGEPEHAGAVTSVAYGKLSGTDYERVITGGRDGKVLLWNLDGTPPVSLPESKPPAVSSLAAGPCVITRKSGLGILAGYTDGKAKFWHVPTPEVGGDPQPEKLMVLDHTAAVTSVCFARVANLDAWDGGSVEPKDYAITGGMDGIARMWDPGREIREQKDTGPGAPEEILTAAQARSFATQQGAISSVRASVVPREIKAITSVKNVEDGTGVEVTTKSPHGLEDGNRIVIWGIENASQLTNTTNRPFWEIKRKGESSFDISGPSVGDEVTGGFWCRLVESAASLVTASPAGMVSLWNLSSGAEVSLGVQDQPALLGSRYVYDNLGIRRRMVANLGDEWLAEESHDPELAADPSLPPETAAKKEPIRSVSTNGFTIAADAATPEFLTEIVFSCLDLKVLADGTVPHRKYADARQNLGVYGFYSNITASESSGNLQILNHWPRLCGIPIFVTRLKKLMLEKNKEGEKEKLQFQGICFEAVLVNPDDVAKSTNEKGLPSFIRDSVARGSVITVRIQRGQDPEIQLDGNIEWTFDLSRQLNESDGSSGFPGRLDRLKGKVSIHDGAMTIGLDSASGAAGTAVVFGRSWPLNKVPAQLVGRGVFTPSEDGKTFHQSIFRFLDPDLASTRDATLEALTERRTAAGELIPSLLISSERKEGLQFHLGVDLGTTVGSDLKLEAEITPKKKLALFVQDGTSRLPAIPAIQQGSYFCFILDQLSQEHLRGRQALMLWVEGGVKFETNTDQPSPPRLGGIFLKEEIVTVAEAKLHHTGSTMSLSGPRVTLTVVSSISRKDSIVWETREYVSWHLKGKTSEEKEIGLHLAEQLLSATDQWGKSSYKAVTGCLYWTAEGRLQAAVRLNPQKGSPLVLELIDDVFYARPMKLATASAAQGQDALHQDVRSSSTTAPGTQRRDVVFPAEQDKYLSFELTEAVPVVPAGGDTGKEGTSSDHPAPAFVHLTLKGGTPAMEWVDPRLVPVDLSLEQDAISETPKASPRTPQLVHRRIYGPRLRMDFSDRDTYESIWESLKQDLEGQPSEFSPRDKYLLLGPVIGSTARINVFEEDFFLTETGEISESFVTENLLTLGRSVPAVPSQGGSGATARDCLSKMPKGPEGFNEAVGALINITAEVSNTGAPEILTKERVQDHLIKTGSAGVAVVRALSAHMESSFRFVKSPFYAYLGEQMIPSSVAAESPRRTLLALAAAEAMPQAKALRPSIDFRLLIPGETRRIAGVDSRNRYLPARPEKDPLRQSPCSPQRALAYRRVDGTSIAPVAGSSVVPSLQLQEATAFRMMEPMFYLPEHARLPGLKNHFFLPARLEVRFGPDKPGAMFHHLLQCRTSSGGGTLEGSNWTLQPAIEGALRDPQHIKVKGCVTASIENLKATCEPIPDEPAELRKLTVRWDEVLGEVPVDKLAPTIKINKVGDDYKLEGHPCQITVVFNDDVMGIEEKDYAVPAYEIVTEIRDKPIYVPSRIFLVSKIDNIFKSEPVTDTIRPFDALIAFHEPGEATLLESSGDSTIKIRIDKLKPPESGNLQENDLIVLSEFSNEKYNKLTGLWKVKPGGSNEPVLERVDTNDPRPPAVDVGPPPTATWRRVFRLSDCLSPDAVPGAGHFWREFRLNNLPGLSWNVGLRFRIFWGGLIKKPKEGGPPTEYTYEWKEAPLFETDKFFKFLSPSVLAAKVAAVVSLKEKRENKAEAVERLQRTLFFGNAAPASEGEPLLVPHADDTTWFRFVVKDNEEIITERFPDVDWKGITESTVCLGVYLVKYLVNGQTIYHQTTADYPT